MSDFLPWELTTETVKALRNADDVSFHFREGTDRPNAWIHATKRIKRTDGFGDDERSIDITAVHKFTIYESSGSSGRRMPTEAFGSIGSAQFDPQWVTVAKLLKAGDRLYLHWTGGDVNRGLKELGWTVIHLDVEIARPVGKSGREDRLVFRVDTRIVPAPSDFYLKMPAENPEYELNV
jgi:hypothetical protein